MFSLFKSLDIGSNGVAWNYTLFMYNFWYIVALELSIRSSFFCYDLLRLHILVLVAVLIMHFQNAEIYMYMSKFYELLNLVFHELMLSYHFTFSG